MTGLPFVWAVWAGRPDVVTPEHVRALTAARDAGVEALDAIAEAFAPPDADEEQREVARAYLHENVSFALDDKGRAGSRSSTRRRRISRSSRRCIR